MTKQVLPDRTQENLPIYSQIWNGLKQFPKGLSEGARNSPEVSGMAGNVN